MNKTAKWTGSFLILISGILWGTMGIFVRNLNTAGFNTLQIVLIRSVVTLVLIGIFLLIKDKKLLKIRIKDLWCFIGTGLISIVMFTYFYFQTITTASLSEAAVLLYTAPIFVMLLSAVFFKERITFIKIIACALAFFGCICVSGILGGSSSLSLISLVTGLLSGIGYALYSIFSRFALDRGYHSFTITFYTFLIATVCVLPFCKVSEMVGAFSASPALIGLSILMGFFTATIPYVCYTMGLNYIEAGKASTMASVEPIVATVVGILFFHEPLTLWGTVGILCVLMAIILLNIRKFSLSK